MVKSACGRYCSQWASTEGLKTAARLRMQAWFLLHSYRGNCSGTILLENMLYYGFSEVSVHAHPRKSSLRKSKKRTINVMSLSASSPLVDTPDEVIYLRVARGIVIVIPSMNSSTVTWQHSREVSVRPGAISNMSSSSSDASGN